MLGIIVINKKIKKEHNLQKCSFLIYKFKVRSYNIYSIINVKGSYKNK